MWFRFRRACDATADLRVDSDSGRGAGGQEHPPWRPLSNRPSPPRRFRFWNDRSGFARPQRALWLTNSTGMTLDGGTFRVWLRHRSGRECQLLRFHRAAAGSRVRLGNGIVIQQSEMREKKSYTCRIAESTARTVIVEHAIRPETTVVGCGSVCRSSQADRIGDSLRGAAARNIECDR